MGQKKSKFSKIMHPRLARGMTGSGEEKLSEQQSKDLKSAFRVLDRDGDGYISMEEVQVAIETMGQHVDHAALDEIFKAVDVDGNGLIDYDEFVSLMEFRMERRSLETEMAAMFAVLDKDNSGFIDAKELQATMANLGLPLTQKDIRVMMKEAGVDVHGKIYYEDFVRMMRNRVVKASGSVSELADIPVEAATHQRATQNGAPASQGKSQDELVAAFASIRRDGKGCMTVGDVIKAFRAIGITAEDSTIQTLLGSAVTSGQVNLSYEEFAQLVTKCRHAQGSNGEVKTPSPAAPLQLEQDRLKETFKLFDKRGDGFITADVLKATLDDLGMKFTADDFGTMLTRAGLDPAGKISCEDFCKLMAAREAKLRKKEEDKVEIKDGKKKLSSEQRKELETLFGTFDKNKDGFISLVEVQNVMHALGLQGDQHKVTNLFQQVDLDGNGLIDLGEFIHMMETRMVGRRRHPSSSLANDMPAMFAAFDKDGSGYIDRAELKETMRELGVQLTDRDVTDMLKEAGGNPDKIYYNDFMKIMLGDIGHLHRGSSTLFQSEAHDRETRIPAVGTSHIPEILNQQNDPDLHAVFCRFDTDGDGSLTSLEVIAAMMDLEMDINESDVRKAVRKVDVDRNGKIEFDEFHYLCRKFQDRKRRISESDSAGAKSCDDVTSVDEGLEEEHLLQLFKLLDTDGDGLVYVSDFRDMMGAMGISQDEAISMTSSSTHDSPASGSLSGGDRIDEKDFLHLVEERNVRIKRRKRVPGDVDEGACHADVAASVGALPAFSQLEAQGLTDEQIKEIQVAFVLFDQDGDGAVTHTELMSVMRSLGLSNNDKLVQHMCSAYDEDGKGTVEFSRFLAMMGQRNQAGKTHWDQTKERTQQPDTWRAFKVLDRNQDGYISAQEFEDTMRELGLRHSQQDVALIMATGDLNGDGRVDYKEFKRLTQGTAFNIEKLKPLLKENSTFFEVKSQHHLADEELHRAFSAFDKTSTGRVRASDLGLILRSLDVTLNPLELHAVMLHYSSIGNGTVDFNEFLNMMSRSRTRRAKANQDLQQKAEEDEMRQAFKVFDIDGNGLIDAQELRQTMKNLGENLSEEDVKAMIRAADKNGDGKIDYEEFIKMMYNK